MESSRYRIIYAKRGFERIAIGGFLCILLNFIFLGLFCSAAAAQQSFPLYCQGPLTTGAPTPLPTGPTITCPFE
jgi:hypothetical protein